MIIMNIIMMTVIRLVIKFGSFTEVKIKSMVFWIMTVCRLSILILRGKKWRQYIIQHVVKYLQAIHGAVIQKTTMQISCNYHIT